MVDDRRGLLTVEETLTLPEQARTWPTWTPSPRELADLELILDRTFGPLRGFLGAADLAAVRESGRLADGTPWPIPVGLSVPGEGNASAAPASDADGVVLTDDEGMPLATMTITERYEAAGDRIGLAGPLTAVGPPEHGPFRSLRATPEQVRARLDEQSRRTEGEAAVLAVVVRDPLHRRILSQIRHITDSLGAEVLVLPLLDGQHPGTLVRAVLAARDDLPGDAVIVPVPLARRDDADPVRELLARAHVAHAYGATHVLAFLPKAVEPDTESIAELSPLPLVFPEPWFYDTQVEVWRPAERIEIEHQRPELTPERLTGLLDRGEQIPDWFTPPAVARELRAAHPPRYERGLTIFFTGLSGSGKSTLARLLTDQFVERGRTVSLLDGDVVRRHLSAGLTFSRADRDLNITRIGYVAAEITRHGGVAICAPIAPYAQTRARVRQMVEPMGDFVLVYVSTPLEVCERRDRKGMYAKARAGIIAEFTGVSDPYEEPDDAEIVLDTSLMSPRQAVERVLEFLVDGGWLRGSAQ